MLFTELAIAGAFLIDVEPHRDDRGFFARTFCSDEFEKRGLVSTIAQCSTSFNAIRGTLRGMHYQAAPHEETKVVRCTAGAIFDVIVDLRSESAMFGKWVRAELTAFNHRMLYIPKGVAHGFQTMEDNTEVYYQISTSFVSEAARGIRWDDPSLDIPWPLRDSKVISPRDESFPYVTSLRS
jgi:dTDP-4-dehydrorhamnose 3,5-epimerase